MQLTLVQDELEFTKMKLAKEIEMSINGRLERREVKLDLCSSLLIFSAGYGPGKTEDWQDLRTHFPSNRISYPQMVEIIGEEADSRIGAVYHIAWEL